MIKGNYVGKENDPIVKTSNQLEMLDTFTKRKLWSSGRALGSEGCRFDPRPMLDGNGVKAMPGPIPAPNSGSL